LPAVLSRRSDPTVVRSFVRDVQSYTISTTCSSERWAPSSRSRARRWTARARPVVELRPDGVWLALPARELLDAQAEA
jgi:hypothetical protein